MGIYSTGKVYGVRWYTMDDHGMNIAYEKKLDTELTLEVLREINTVFVTLTDDTLQYQTFDKCWSSLDSTKMDGTFMCWMLTDTTELGGWLKGKLCVTETTAQ